MATSDASEIYMEVFTPTRFDDCGRPEELGKVQAFGYSLTPDETEAFARWLIEQAAIARMVAP